MKPPVHLNALKAFESSARHRSFSAAAAELHVTPAALGLERLQEGAANGVLTVTVSPAFAAKWLLPRIHRFQAACPDIDVRLDTSTRPLDFVARGIDIGVRYGSGRWPGLQAEKLMDEEVYPVCSPQRLQGRRRAIRPRDLLSEPLIHDLTMDGHAGFPTWSDWLRQAGVGEATSRRGMKINNSAAVLQAAVEGHGFALARSVMARDDLAAGRLVRLFPEVSCASTLAHHVVHRPERATLPKLAAFRAWLIREAGSDEATPLRPRSRGLTPS
jgi:LysR family glycine cleavage system transcriptional activator